MKYLLVILALSAQLLFGQGKKNSIVKIDEARKSGKISEAESVKLKLKMLHGEPLASEYASESTVKCLFGAAMDIHHYAKSHPHELLKISKTASQFVLVHSFIDNGDTIVFHINYDTTGTDAVPTLDSDFNGIPDWVDETARTFEHVYRVEVDTFGYIQPAAFAVDGFLSVYIENIPDAYGYTQPEIQVTGDPDGPYTSFIAVRNNYNGFYTQGYDALHVTCAHEFHHTIQLSYEEIYETDGWYYESTAVWMEDVVYNAVNDYYAYLPFYFSETDMALNTYDGSHEYGSVVWNHFVAKNYGRNVIKKSWENMPIDKNAVHSIDDALQSQAGSGISEAFGEFSVWNYFTAGRADSVNFYPEALYYPPVRLALKTVLTDTAFSKSLPNLSANYFSLIAQDYENYSLGFTSGVSPGSFNIITVVYNALTNKKVIAYHPGGGEITVGSLVQGDTLTVIAANVRIPNGTYAYSLDLRANNAVNSYPSPFNLRDAPGINWRFRLSASAGVRIDIFSLSGKLVRRLDFGTLTPGSHDGGSEAALRWDGKDSGGHQLPGGIYIYKFTGGDVHAMGKIAIVR